MGRGGKRPGAGRKTESKRVVISARVTQTTKDTLDRLRKQGQTTGQLIDRLVADYVAKTKTWIEEVVDDYLSRHPEG